MIDVTQLYRLTYQDVSSEQRRGYVSPQEITRAINNAQDILYSFYLARGAERPLRPFAAEQEVKVDDQGLVDLPDDFNDLRVLYAGGKLSGTDGGNRDVRLVYRLVDAGKFHSVAEDDLLRGSLANETAWACYAKGTIRLAPAVSKVVLDYYRRPQPARLSFDYSGAGGIAAVDRKESIDLEWEQSETPNFVTLLLASLGISVGSGELIEYAQAQGMALSSNLSS